MARGENKQEYTILGNPWEGQEQDSAGSENIARLEEYHYFDGRKINYSMEMSPATRREGEKLCAQKKVAMRSVVSGFERSSEEILGQANAVVQSGRNEYALQVTFSRDAVEHFTCNCPKCRRDYYSSWYTNKTDCANKAAVLCMLEEFLATHNLGDSTDPKGMELLSAFQRKRAIHAAGAAAKEDSLKLVPRLVKKEGKLSLSFKVGSGRLFVVKKLDEFCEQVRSSATVTYGASTPINHSLTNFSEKGKEWIQFINRVVQEELAFGRRMAEANRHYGYRIPEVGGSLNLFGWRLDEFYDRLGEEALEYEDRDGGSRAKGTLYRKSGNPRVTMRISAAGAKGQEFHGIQVEGSLPELFRGVDTAYYVGGDGLYRTEQGFLEQMGVLSGLSREGEFRFRVGRNHLAEFYYGILPQLEDSVEVTESDPELFRSYLPPEAHFVFYLDARDQDLFCRPCARYGDKEVSVLDHLQQRPGILAPFRDEAGERETLYLVRQWFPQPVPETGELCCGGREAAVYEVMASGLEKLMEAGEVRCTKRFLGYRVVNRVKVNVGVSVSSGMLNLDISTEDISQAELLELLESYHLKQKYYRLKDGSFVNMEDPSLEMLSELMDSMHLKPKEFIKGRMHLPVYRTLYLDKMLEENDSVYSHRDSHFREMVKGFKTVKDADFEEPESLSRIMRNYQKNGYKWLRTLEAWGFGGILADDMGLGKTLQVIAVLLAAKQEGKEGPSLVVCPASLVFNWEEEFHRFAPELSVLLLTGTQGERQEKLDTWREYDVLVTSYDLLKRDIASYEDREFLYQVIDEAQYIKNHTTAAAKAVKVVRSRHRYALTGTPIENRLSELWSIFDYLMPGFLYSYETFKKEIETPAVKNQDGHAMQRLQRMVGPFILRRLKEEVLGDLPEKLEELRYVRFGESQQHLYDGQVVHMKEMLARQDDAEFGKNKMKILAELTRLRQICCDPSLCFEGYHGGTAKVEAVLELIQSAIDGGHRILLFSQFTSMLEILERELDRAGIPWYTITGATAKEKRLQLVKEFNEGSVPVFLISLKAGGVGLNLTGADVVIHYDPWWNLAVQNQATDRAHRIGQTKKVTVYKLIVKNSIEEKIQKLQETKRDLADQVISGGTGQQLGSMTKEELLELLGGSAPEDGGRTFADRVEELTGEEPAPAPSARRRRAGRARKSVGRAGGTEAADSFGRDYVDAEDGDYREAPKGE